MWYNDWFFFNSIVRDVLFIKYVYGFFVIIFKINFNGFDIIFFNIKILSDSFLIVVNMFIKFFDVVVRKYFCLIEKGLYK